VATPRDDLRQRVQLEQKLVARLRTAALRFSDAETERIWAIAFAHQAGLSIRKIAGATGLSRGLSSNWTENRVKPGRGSHFFLPYRDFSPSTTLRDVPSGATCRYSVCRVIVSVTPDPRAINTQGRDSFVMPEAVAKGNCARCETRPIIRTEAVTATGPCHNRKTSVYRSVSRQG
jgi:hypothetical protein